MSNTATPRLTVEQLNEQIKKLCAENGYRQTVGAIGKKSGQQCALVDVVIDGFIVDIFYVEVKPNGAIS